MVNTVLYLVLAGVAAVAPHADEQQTQRVTVGARVHFPSGKAAGALQQRVTLGPTPTVWYVFTGKTLCEAQTVSSEKPAFAGNGWRVELKPTAAGTVSTTWERLWVNGKAASGGGTKSIALGSGTPAVLDSIDGGSRLQRQEELNRTLIDAVSSRISAELAELERRRRHLLDVQKLGTANTQVVAVDADIQSKKMEQIEHLAAARPAAVEALRNSPLTPVDGCDALSMSLQVTAEVSIVSEPAETEIWLVHKDTAGLETVQRQVVRSATGSASYVFDDIVIKTERGPITVEVSGSIGLRNGANFGNPSGMPQLIIDVNRRYITTAAGATFGWKTKEGGTQFSQAIRPDEVVAFNLMPLKDDEGIFVGHRFSVRVRTKILK